MSHEHTETPDQICSRIPVLCRAIDAVECRCATSRLEYMQKVADIKEMTKMLCDEAFDASLYNLSMKQISTYLVDHGGLRWSEKKFTVSKDGWDVKLVKRK
jgi:hypothetical protein